MGSFLSDTFFKSFSSKYVYVEAATTTAASSHVLSPVYTVLTPTYMWSAALNKRLQLYTRLLEKQGINEAFFCDSCSNLEIDKNFQNSHKLGIDLAE
jgi:hypothetical protein